MARTNKGIYYPDNYSAVADIPEDMKEMAESVDEAMENSETTFNAALANKVDKIEGKELSTEDYTTAEKTKLENIEAQANKTVVDSELSSSSTNPVQNKKVYEALANKVDKIEGKGLSTNDYDNTEKGQVSTNAEDIQELQEECERLRNDLNNGTLSVEGTGETVALDGTVYATFKQFGLGGNTSQEGTPSPDSRQVVNVVSGDNTITIASGGTEQISKVYPINLPYGTEPMELCKIGDYQDKIFKAINGDKVYDSLTSSQKNTLTYGKWYKYEAIGKVVLDGSEDGWELVNRDSHNVFQNARIVNSIDGRNIYSAFSDYFKGASGQDVWRYIAPNIIGIAENNKLRIYSDNFATLDAFKTWLSTHNTILYYILATPRFIEITNTTLISQLEALRKAVSYKTQTNISQTNNDKPFILDVNAIGDINSLLTRIEVLETEV